ncbi:hypothetical protein U1Q18_040731, partial [Sarracenia purpurea var. burkii]
MPSFFSKKESVSSPVAKPGVAAKLQRMNGDKPDPDEDKGASRLMEVLPKVDNGVSSPSEAKVLASAADQSDDDGSEVTSACEEEETSDEDEDSPDGEEKHDVVVPSETQGIASKTGLLGEGIPPPVSDEVKLPGSDFVPCSGIDCGTFGRDRVLPLEGNPGYNLGAHSEGSALKASEMPKITSWASLLTNRSAISTRLEQVDVGASNDSGVLEIEGAGNKEDKESDTESDLGWNRVNKRRNGNRRKTQEMRQVVKDPDWLTSPSVTKAKQFPEVASEPEKGAKTVDSGDPDEGALEEESGIFSEPSHQAKSSVLSKVEPVSLQTQICSDLGNDDPSVGVVISNYLTEVDNLK